MPGKKKSKSPAPKKKSLLKKLGISKKGGKKSLISKKSISKKAPKKAPAAAKKATTKKAVKGRKSLMAGKTTDSKAAAKAKEEKEAEPEEAQETEAVPEETEGGGETEAPADDTVAPSAITTTEATEAGAGSDTVYAPVLFSSEPQEVMCPQCEEVVTTQTAPAIGVCSLICCFFFGWACCLPLLCKACKDIQHSCPTCHIALGRYRRWRWFN